ncbi:MAG: fibronectin type III domain-containing protein [Acidobacteria bacterium]|nr:fibronectin type III domain-containing protein [Acidobacteriota bacterium]
MSSCRSKLVPSFAFSSALALALSLPALAADVTKPGRVAGLIVEKSTDGAFLTWTPVATDAAGQPELVDFYAVYRGTTPDFVPDTANGTNRIGSATVSEFLDSGALLAPESFFYRVTAIDAAGNESTTRNPLVASVPVLSGSWTDTSIVLSWTSAEPVANVAGYRVHYGKRPGVYESVDDVGLATSHTLTGLELLVNWYVAVTAVDIHGNETAFSNEHVDAIAGRVRTLAHDKADICWALRAARPSRATSSARTARRSSCPSTSRRASGRACS